MLVNKLEDYELEATQSEEEKQMEQIITKRTESERKIYFEGVLAAMNLMETDLTQNFKARFDQMRMITSQMWLGMMEKPQKDVLNIIERYGGIDGDHHKTWVIDQVARALLGNNYEAWVKEMKAGEDGADTYDWDEGIPP